MDTYIIKQTPDGFTAQVRFGTGGIPPGGLLFATEDEARVWALKVAPNAIEQPRSVGEDAGRQEPDPA